MAPAKSSKNGTQDDAKADSTGHEKKTGAGAHLTSSKMRKVASSTGSQLREVTNASSTSAAAAAATGPTTSAASKAAAAAEAREKKEAANPTINWNSFERDTLHAYCREHRLRTPTSYSSSYRHMVLSSQGSIGHYSPTMLRKRQDKRQSKAQLALAVRKHFNGLGVQENDVIVDFIHKVRSHGILKADRLRRPSSHLEADK